MRQPQATYAPDGLMAGMVLPKSVSRGRVGMTAGLTNAVLAQLPLAVAVIDAGLRLLYWNEAAAGVFGVPPMLASEMPPLAGILSSVAHLDLPQRDRIMAFVAAEVAAGGRTEPDSCLRVSLGRERRIVLQVRGLSAGRWMLVIDDGRMPVASGRDGAARSDAWLDALTGLSNRRHCNEVLRGMVDGATQAAVLTIDLDRFGPINDTLGHAVGDALLCLVAQRLRRETRDEDLLVRLGSDEFVILLANGARAEALATRVIESLSKPFLVEGHLAEISASIGISRFPDHGPTADDLMRHAALALSEAKNDGRRTWRVFAPETALAA
ncbi:MAG TPA: diguanylate cyclase [Rhodopila sp.]